MVRQPVVINLGSNWNEQGPSLGLDTLSFIFAIGLHVPLFFMQLNTHKKAVQAPTERLVSIDLLDQLKPKEEAPPPPPIAAPKNSLMEKLKMLVKKEPPPPPPPQIKPAEKLLEAPKPLPLQAKLDLPQKIEPTLASKSGFQTKADPNMIKESKLAMTGVPGIAPLSAKKLGVVDDRNTVKNNKGNFQVKSDSLKDIGGDGPGLVGAAPVIAIKTGNAGSTEKFSAPTTQKTDKGRLGAVSSGNLGGPQLGLRDSIIQRDAAPSQIATGRAGGMPGGIPGGVGTKRDAGSFQGGSVNGVAGGVAGGSGSSLGGIKTAAPSVGAVVPKKRDKQMFTITGPLKDRKILHQIAPEYPSWAQAQGISAAVVLEFTVEPDGSVKNLIVVRRTSGYPKLDDTAIQALKQWKFAPLPDGENRDEVGMITFNYSLS